ncbi:transcriptional regulator [Streptomyces sp. NPDC054796]
MRRRSLVTAAGLSVPASLVSLDTAFAAMPSPKQPPSGVPRQLRRAQALFDSGRLKRMPQALEELLATAEAAAEDRTPAACAQVSHCYTLASHYLSKIAQYRLSGQAADRARTWAKLSGDPLAEGASARALSIVLRHQDQPQDAALVTRTALNRIEATGLPTPRLTAMYAQMLCTAAYTAARAGDRDDAHELIAEARRSTRRLPATPREAATITPAAVGLYEVGVHWALHDAGAAVEAGQRLHPTQFRSPERRGRLHTDLARAWWQWGRPEQTAEALLSAAREARTEVLGRPSIRRIAVDLVRQHPQAPGVRDLSYLIGARSTARHR